MAVGIHALADVGRMSGENGQDPVLTLSCAMLGIKGKCTAQYLRCQNLESLQDLPTTLYPTHIELEIPSGVILRNPQPELPGG